MPTSFSYFFLSIPHFSGANKLSTASVEENPCNKDTGTLTQLRGHSRGILPVISGGGIIHAWTHLYKSESPSQVAVFIIAFFCMLLQSVPNHIRKSKKYVFTYDNICNLSNMKLWQNPFQYQSKVFQIYRRITWWK